MSDPTLSAQKKCMERIENWILNIIILISFVMKSQLNLSKWVNLVGEMKFLLLMVLWIQLLD